MMLVHSKIISNYSLFNRGIIFFLVAIILLILSCFKGNIPEVPENLIEDAIIAWETDQRGWMFDNMYCDGDRPDKGTFWVDDPSYTQEQRDLLKDMIDSAVNYNISYNWNRATVVVDFSKTGLMEWKYVNRMGIPPNRFPTNEGMLGKNRVFYLIYVDNQWKYGWNTGELAEWPEPEFFD